MKVFITGGTGFIGTSLIQGLQSEGYDILVLTRKVRDDRLAPAGVGFIEGDPVAEGEWQKGLADADVIINLAGASIFRRWSDRSKSEIRDSRILTTRNIVDGIKSGNGKEPLLLSASAVGYYGFHEDREIMEGSPPGDDFLASVCKEWEAAAIEASRYGARVTVCRFGIVLGRKGGAMAMMLPLFKMRLGSRLGNGQQWFSWIHEQDLIHIILFLIKRKGAYGEFNCTSPQPVRNRDMTRVLKRVLKKPSFIPPVPGFMIKLIMGEFGNILLKGQKVLPHRITGIGYEFKFPDIQGALKDLICE